MLSSGTAGLPAGSRGLAWICAGRLTSFGALANCGIDHDCGSAPTGGTLIASRNNIPWPSSDSPPGPPSPSRRPLSRTPLFAFSLDPFSASRGVLAGRAFPCVWLLVQPFLAERVLASRRVSVDLELLAWPLWQPSGPRPVDAEYIFHQRSVRISSLVGLPFLEPAELS